MTFKLLFLLCSAFFLYRISLQSAVYLNDLWGRVMLQHTAQALLVTRVRELEITSSTTDLAPTLKNTRKKFEKFRYKGVVLLILYVF